MPATIGVTLGELSGIGPEVMLAALRDLPHDAAAQVFVPAPAARAEWWQGLLQVQAARQVGAGAIEIALVRGSMEPVQPGRSTPATRADALAALTAMADAAVARSVAAVVTGPVPKAIFADAAATWPGQTEYLAHRLGVTRFAMMLAGPRLRVVPVTTHVPLRAVAALLSTDSIVGATLAAVAELQAVFGIARPRVGVCGLNPHAGEGGRCGDEEAAIIVPAIAALVGQGVAASGPLPADTAFRAGWCGQLDVVIAMYHDQALGPLKTVHGGEAVNLTCGLPVPRLSPDHGTAYDIAGLGRADATSARSALALACQAAGARRGALP